MSTEPDLNLQNLCRSDFELELRARREIPRIVSNVLETFDEADTMAHVDLPAMPDEPTVIQLIEMLQSLIFPGYYGRNKIERHNLIYYIGELAIRIYDALAVQLSRSFRNDCSVDGKTFCEDCDEHGRTLALAFLDRIPALRRTLLTDVRAAFDGDPAAKSLDEIIFCYPGLKAVMVYRIAHALHKLDVPIIPRMMTEYAHRLTGIDIHPGATLGDGFFIDHGTGVVIGETTLIGENVQLYQGVTLGALRFPKDAQGNILRGVKRHPTIEDDVTIYAQATILGGDTVIGRGSVIGGNVWLTHSVPAYSVVQNDPAKIKLREKATQLEYLDYSI